MKSGMKGMCDHEPNDRAACTTIYDMPDRSGYQLWMTHFRRLYTAMDTPLNDIGDEFAA